ncbi:hypothetical protein IF1G_00170 [Cordyceps javanica]|uniref:Uncharacterized protein n=1 Tax=Cordyceps javanica TaxID=43265 RepID=A0A545VEV2_9HYPO|nr:hypothetical protein IF1G_00170 [Cordyceps javanica]
MTPEPDNLDGLIQGLSDPRASLSPSGFSVAAFKDFTRANDRVISQGNVIARILPKILGDSDILSEGNLIFTNLDSITDGTTVNPAPDLFNGSRSKDVDKIVRQEPSKTIIPTSHTRAPVVPDFFLEARMATDVAKRQACLDGAIAPCYAQSAIPWRGRASP